MVQASQQTVTERKAALHAQIDLLEGEQLTAVERTLLKLEAERLAAELGAEFDEAWRDGRITEESIQAAIAEHRAKHPYR